MKKMPPFPSSAICYDNDDCDVCDVFDFVMFLIDMLKKTKTLMDLSWVERESGIEDCGDYNAHPQWKVGLELSNFCWKVMHIIRRGPCNVELRPY